MAARLALALLLLMPVAACGGSGSEEAAPTTTARASTTTTAEEDTTAWCAIVREAAQAEADLFNRPDVRQQMREALSAAEATRISDEYSAAADRWRGARAAVKAAPPPQEITDEVATVNEITADSISIKDEATRDKALTDIASYIAVQCDVRYSWE